MDTTDIPGDISYSIHAKESVDIRDRLDRNANRALFYPMIASILVVELAAFLLRLRQYGWNYPLMWVQPTALIAFVIFAISLPIYRRRHVPAAMRPDVATRVTFEDRSFDVVRDGRAPKTVPVLSVRAVSTTDDAFLVRTTWASPMLVIPKRAFADGGDAFLRYFEQRLVARRMLHPSSPRTSIVNTVIP